MSTVVPGRIVPLDGLRGVAVMGILLMNVHAFAMPFAAYDNPANYGPLRTPDILVWALELLFVDGKMRAIFSGLFGASLLLVAERAEAAGRSAARVHYARMGTLLLFGIAHACLLWEGDILVLYALVGMAAFPLRRLPVDRLLVLAAMLMALAMALLGLHYQALAALAEAAQRPGAPPADMALWRDVLDQIGRPRGAALAADLGLHASNWPTLVRARTADLRAGWLQDLILNGPETLGLMALGMAGLRSGFLTGAWPRARYRRWARVSFAIGLPPMAAMAIAIVGRGFPPLATSLLTDLAAMPFRWLLAIAIAALIVPWFVDARTWLTIRIAAAGRMAFSNYLGTSLVMTALFDGWGLGLYGRIERWMLLPFVLLAWAAMLGWSRPWLARVRRGPLEAAWRFLARRAVSFT